MDKELIEKCKLTDVEMVDVMLSIWFEYHGELLLPKLRILANQAVTKAIPIIQDERDSKWVDVLKKYKLTVDSPEALAVAVDTLIAEAKKQVMDEIEKYETPTVIDLNLIQISMCREDWQALKGEGNERTRTG